MTVAELIAELKKMPKTAVVMQSKDAEGNGFKRTVDVCLSHFDPEWGEVLVDQTERSFKVVVLWP